MTHDASRAGVALQEPPGRKGPRRHRTGDETGPDLRSRRARPRAGPRRRRPGPATLLLGIDAAALLLSILPLAGRIATILVVAPVALAVYAGAGLYRPRLNLSVLDDLPALVGGVVVGVCAGAALAPALPAAAAGQPLRMVAALAAAVVAGRTVAYPLLRRRRRRNPSCRTVIVGATAVGRELGRILLERPEYGLRPVGYLDEMSAPARRSLPAPLLGSCQDLLPTLQALDVRCVLVAFGTSRPAQLVELLRSCDRHRCQVLFVPRFYELHQTNRQTDTVGGIPLVRLRSAGRQRPTWRLKRATDLVLAALGLILAAPVMAACALAIRLEGGPGVLFRQERIGMDERPFTMVKLRTLRPSSEWESRTKWSVANDPRLGPVGRFLRATSLDEVPQLANVLRGEMSLVGPRPERPFFVEEFSRRIPDYAARHRVRAGLTGWAAVNGLRGDTSIEARVSFDNSYIENWSLWLDIKIMIRTVGAVLARSSG
jgi:exopolysaccharide biosynthesis polyprenyl glycosylphosphotransferase